MELHIKPTFAVNATDQTPRYACSVLSNVLPYSASLYEYTRHELYVFLFPLFSAAPQSVHHHKLSPSSSSPIPAPGGHPTPCPTRPSVLFILSASPLGSLVRFFPISLFPSLLLTSLSVFPCSALLYSPPLITRHLFIVCMTSCARIAGN